MIHPTVKIEPGAVIYDNVEIGENSIIGANAVLRPGTKIGKNTIFGTGSVSEGDNQIGDHCTIHAQCHITAGLTIEDRVFIAPFFCQANTPDLLQGPNVKYGRPQNYPHERLEGRIKEGTVIGCSVTVNPGITIGRYAKVDMCSYITKNVPDYAHIRSGNEITAKKIGNTNLEHTWKRE